MSTGNFAATRTKLGLTLVTARVFTDDRGFFYETWSEAALRDLGIDARFVQDNHSQSRRGVIRGLHWQAGAHAQGKLVRCTQGRILDVVVDIREGSPSFGAYEATQLTAALAGESGCAMLYVPPGFAHGFQALNDFVEVQYKVTAPWSAASERCIAYDDPDLRIAWRASDPPVVSAKDRAGMSFAEYRKKPDFRWEGKP